MKLFKFSALFALSLTLILILKSPASGQDSLQIVKVESDDPRIVQSGNWQKQETDSASGGSYLYSTGSPEDVLTLHFQGTYIEVVYLTHPAFGTLAIEVDGQVLRTVVTSNPEITFDQRAVINYLSEDKHVLRIYASNGTIAIDAFYTSVEPIQLVGDPALLEKARTEGKVRVIVGFQSNFRLEAELANDKAVESQRAEIDHTRRTLIANLSSFEFKVNAGSDHWFTPQIALEVDEEALRYLMSAPLVESIHEDEILKPTLAESTELIGATRVWDYYEGTGQTIAILDTGVDSNHPFFGNRILAEACFSSGGDISLCPNGQPSQIGPGAASPERCEGVYTCEHGTFVAGIAAGNGQEGNVAPFSGVARLANIIAVQVYSRVDSITECFPRTSCLRAYVADINAALVYIYDLHDIQGWDIAAVNLSLGVGEYTNYCDDYPLSTMIQSLRINGIATIVASGNDGYTNAVNAPACISASISVGAINNIYEIAPFSNSAEILNLLAPGVDIISSVPIGTSSDTNGDGFSDEGDEGTSHAAPHVTGAWALLKDYSPAATVDEILLALTDSGILIHDSRNNTIKPLINVANAFNILEPPVCNLIDLPKRVSVGFNNNEANTSSFAPAISADSRYIVFQSDANNLVVGDTSGYSGIFLYDQFTCQMNRVSVSSRRIPGNNNSYTPDISSDGRFVTFISFADNLVSGDTNGKPDVFVYDRETLETSRVSVSSSGDEGNDVSAYTGGGPSISGDGRYIVFGSLATNLVAGDENEKMDVFLHERTTGQTSRISRSSSGIEGNGDSGGPVISGDGRFVAYSSYASNLVPGDTNGHLDIFIYDMTTGQTTRLSVSTAGNQGNDDSGVGGPISISSDGRYVAFISKASNLVVGDTNDQPDAFVHDRATGQTTRVSISTEGIQANGPSYAASISGNGRFVTIQSLADNLVAGDTNGWYDIFVHDRQTSETILVSTSSAGIQGNGPSSAPIISDDGRFIAFESEASNLVAGDTNFSYDIFVTDLDRFISPKNLIATTVSDSQIDLVWTDEFSTQSEYLIERSPDGVNNWIQIGVTSFPFGITTFSDTDLPASTTFYYRVRAHRLVSNSYTNYSNVDAEKTSPLAPSGLSVQTFSTTQLNLTWDDNSPDETMFLIERSVNGINWNQIATAPSNTETYQDTSLTCQTTYHYRIRAYRTGIGQFAEVHSAYSNTAQQTTTECSLAPPTNLVVIGTGETTVNLGWTDNSSSETAFRVERSENQTIWAEVATVGANIILFQDEGLQCASVYYYRVRAYRSDGNVFSDYSNSVQATTLACPGSEPMTQLGPSGNITSHTPTFNWTKDENAQWYHLLIQTSGNVTVFDQWSQLGNGVVCSGEICAFKPTTGIGNVVGSSALKWSIQPYDSISGIGAWVGPMNFTITTTSLTAPIGTVTDPQGNPTYQWNAVADATWYQIYMMKPGSGVVFSEWFDATSVCSGGVCSSKANTKLSNGAHQAWMQAYSADGFGAWSGPFNFGVSVPTLPVITKLTPANGAPLTNAAVNFTWTHNVNARSYELYLAGPNGFVDFRAWEAATYCGGATCSTTITVPANGSYTWYLHGLNAGGSGAWGSSQTFTVNAAVPGLISKSTPVGITETDGDVTFMWQHDPNAVAYDLYVSGPNGYVDYHLWDAATYCSGGSCSVTLQVTSDGVYSWYLRGKGQTAFGAWGTPPSHGLANFTVDTSVPGEVTKLSPTNNQQLTSTVVTLTWQETLHAEGYDVYVGGPAGYVHYQLHYTGTDVTCPAGICSLTLALPSNGSYQWYMRAWSPAGYGGWGNPNFGLRTFQMQVSAPTPHATLVAPADGAIFTSNPIPFQWQAVANVTWYNVVLINRWTGAIVSQTWYSASAAGCALGGTCSVNQTVANGNYRWAVMTWGPGSTGVPPYQPGVTPSRTFDKLG